MRGTDVPRRMPNPWTTRRSPNADVPSRVSHPWSKPRISEAKQPRRRTLSEPISGDSARRALSASAASERTIDHEAALLAELESDPGSGRSARSRPSVRRLGDGLVAMPQVSPLDPRTSMLERPEVPEHKRFCWKCQQPVGRTIEDEPGAVVGECDRCRSPFNFRPALQAGEMVSGQYEVQGSLAHGGLGWIYLAIDRNVSDRWVVLKGLQNPLDFEAHVVALAERQFLSEVAYPGIVKIYNFVKHRSTRDVADGYIVMEYVGGRSLKKMLDLCAPERLSVSDAIAYMMEILPALDYLHSFGLAYNDLKPDNIMVSEDEVKLIDLGAVAAMESYGSIYGTPGYQAPEITDTGPTVASDVYTVGRTLAALILELPKDGEGHYLPGLPTPEQQPLFRRNPALYRLLRRATDPDPKRRFPSAYSFYCQLAGVLRMVLAADTGLEHPQASIEFGSMRGDFGIETLIGQTDGMTDGRHRLPALDAPSVVAALSVPLMDGDDPSADLLSTLLHGDPRKALDSLRRAADRIVSGTIPEPETFELEGTLIAVRAHLDLGDVVLGCDRLADLRPRYNADWRLEWYTAIAALLDGQYQRAYEYFDLVHSMLPGELAPAQALAATAELALQHLDTAADAQRWHRLATEYYRTVWRTNHGAVSAAFGLARRLAADGQLLEAVAILDQVPEASRYHSVARMTGCLLLVSRPVADITEVDLTEAATRLDAAPDEPRALQLQVIVVGAALEWLRAGGQSTGPDTTILGFPVTELGLQLGLETSLRGLARISPHRLHRYRLVDLANYVRPHTRF
ncbi:serine/threonine-protein kinase [Nocardia australiensis]|uniref:serine/threonine-protein kinase n=1 Tax=Nocardia australiensis TaxID=2887191 RepID=UPI001D15532A|nr:serine/threonine-protein kinase [Nocardia australiensis]